jgi:hypothetical protein
MESLSDWQLQLVQTIVHVLDAIEQTRTGGSLGGPYFLSNCCSVSDLKWLLRFSNPVGRRYVFVKPKTNYDRKDVLEVSWSKFQTVMTFGCVFGIGHYNIESIFPSPSFIFCGQTNSTDGYVYSGFNTNVLIAGEEKWNKPGFMLTGIEMVPRYPDFKFLECCKFWFEHELPLDAPSILIGKDRETKLSEEIDEATKQTLHRDLLPIIIDYLRFPRECIFGTYDELALHAFDILDLSDPVVPPPYPWL